MNATVSNRIKTVARVLATEGWHSLTISLGGKINIFHKLASKKPEPTPVRVRKMFERLGGAFLKLGQLLSIRPDLVPLEYSKEFKKLQDNVKPISFSKVLSIIGDETNRFDHINKKPLGSASVAQVHKAKLSTGKDVVIKVKRPDADKVFHADIEVMHYLASIIHKKYPSLDINPIEIVNEFERFTKDELDFSIEGRNIQLIHNVFKDDPFIVIPNSYFAKKNLLVMDFVKGKKLTNKPDFKLNKEIIANRITRACLKMVFQSPLFHADLHPGNILISKGNKVALIDFGIVGSLTKDQKDHGLFLIYSLANRNAKSVYDSLVNLGSWQGDPKKGLKFEVFNIVDSYKGRSLKHERITHVLHKLFDSCNKYGLKLPKDLYILGKSLVTAEGSCIKFFPDFDFVNSVKPYLKNLLKKEFLDDISVKGVIDKVIKSREYLSDLPRMGLAALSTLERGRIKVDINESEIKQLGKDLDISSDRIALALVTTGFVVAGAIILHVKVAPFYNGYPMLALLCFSLAFIMFAALLAALLRKSYKEI